MSTRFKRSLDDLKAIYTQKRVWAHLGWSDIRQKYVGSFLGPFWITLSLAIFLVALGIVYTKIFHQPVKEYIPFLACGLLIWTYISGIIVDSCDVFVFAKPYIMQLNLPISTYLYRVVWRHIIIFLHNILVFFVVALIFQVKISWYMLLSIPGFMLVTLNMISIGLLIGIISTRFRDMPPIVTSMTQILFFVSPVTWMPNMVGKSSLIVYVNPVSYFLNLIRAPLLNQPFIPHVWFAAFAVLLLTSLLSLAFFTKKRDFIPYWL